MSINKWILSIIYLKSSIKTKTIITRYFRKRIYKVSLYENYIRCFINWFVSLNMDKVVTASKVIRDRYIIILYLLNRSAINTWLPGPKFSCCLILWRSCKWICPVFFLIKVHYKIIIDFFTILKINRRGLVSNWFVLLRYDYQYNC